jgi:hypothetical protein
MGKFQISGTYHKQAPQPKQEPRQVVKIDLGATAGLRIPGMPVPAQEQQSDERGQ